MLPDEANPRPTRGDRPVRLRDAPAAFCTRCRLDGSAVASLCSECGERLVPRGYCPTCEGSWRLRVGDPCPKHDLPLEPAPPPPEPIGQPGRPAEAWVTVATFGHPNEANAPRIRLEAEGVPTFLDGERIASSALYQVATGGVRLQVPGSQAATARILLAQTWAAPPINPDDADDDLHDDDDPWLGLAPEPGTRRRAIMKVAIVVFLFGPGLVTLVNVLAGLLGWRL